LDLDARGVAGNLIDPAQYGYGYHKLRLWGGVSALKGFQLSRDVGMVFVSTWGYKGLGKPSSLKVLLMVDMASWTVLALTWCPLPRLPCWVHSLHA